VDVLHHGEAHARLVVHVVIDDAACRLLLHCNCMSSLQGAENQQPGEKRRPGPSHEQG